MKYNIVFVNELWIKINATYKDKQTSILVLCSDTERTGISSAIWVYKQPFYYNYKN